MTRRHAERRPTDVGARRGGGWLRSPPSSRLLYDETENLKKDLS
jgi:hypothetical protein